MREALVRAAQAQPGVVSGWIRYAAQRIKPRKFGGWSVINKRKRNGKRSK